MITLDQVHKTYVSDSGAIEAVAPTSLRIERGEIFGIIGRSGAGKSTLLRIMSGLEQPGGGRMFVGRQEVTLPLLGTAADSIRMIHPRAELLEGRSLLSNVALPLEATGVPAREAHARAVEQLERVGLADKAHIHAAGLSDAGRQRVAIARALATKPSVLLYDEPASAGDARAERVLATLQTVNRDLGLTIVIATRSHEVARRVCDAAAIMENGRVVEQIRLGDLLAAPRTELARLLFAHRPVRQAQPRELRTHGSPGHRVPAGGRRETECCLFN